MQQVQAIPTAEMFARNEAEAPSTPILTVTAGVLAWTFPDFNPVTWQIERTTFSGWQTYDTISGSARQYTPGPLSQSVFLRLVGFNGASPSTPYSNEAQFVPA